MVKTNPRDNDLAAAQGVQDVVSRLLSTRSLLAADLAEYLIVHMPELREVGVEDLVLKSCRANITALFDNLARAVPVESIAPSPELIDYTRGFVRDGLPLDSIMQAYRLGTAYLITRWTDAAAEQVPGAAAIGVIKGGTAYLLEWLGVMSNQLADEYRGEVSRLAKERSQARLEDIREILNNFDIEIEAASRRLGYRLADCHLAIALRDVTEGRNSGAALDSALRDLTGALDVTNRLAVYADRRTVWCWLRWTHDQSRELPVPAAPVLMAAGRPWDGIAGFRRSHLEALDALRIAGITGRRAATLTHFEDVNVAAMCTADVDRARDFVRTELAALSADDERTRRIRETLSAFYAANSNFRATATKLGIHHNTVRYRLEQAERALGRPVGERRLALELALHLRDTLAPTSRDATPG
ncbi:hypothetical protein D0Z08_16210 [Nocardioides immobilis]|uniref:PucR family transcriptional regulator n=1 Tax=Nocardioides immobilis TaxID=2049295 RepID=A0A417Y0K9_9ACTN|nr:helix-turn-helix domain-containing protein [Nocardioides immobilis]RHW26179.1 hypothetical protein D0Z08_16210 [Nocardioides immobilis]